jgi:hypothetical protein
MKVTLSFLPSEALLPTSTSIAVLVTELCIRAVSIFDGHYLINTLVTSTNHFAEFVR